MTFLSQGAYAQFTDAENEIIKEAEEYFQLQDFQMTWNLLTPIAHIHVDDAHVNYLLGVSGMNMPRYKHEAMAHLRKSASSEYVNAYLPYATTLLESGRVDECLTFLDQVPYSESTIQRVDQLKAHSKNALDSRGKEVGVVIQPLGNNINTDYKEHTPLIAMNDSILYFTSRRPANAKSEMDFNGEYDENIYQVHKSKTGWGDAQLINGNVNQILNEATVALRPSGEEMIIFKTSRNFESSDLWLVKYSQGEWKLDKKLDVPINSKFIENSATINTEGNLIYVSSDRPGGYGGFDLYRIVRFGNGDLSEPQNLGPTINSAYNEISPFLLPDGETLFFSSDNLSSMGGYDIFHTKSINDTTWVEPQPLAPPLNTTADNLHITISWKTGQAYFIRPNPSNLGDFDICTSNMPGFNIQANVILGSIIGYSEDDVPEITLFSKDFSETIGVYNVNDRGEFIVVLLPGESGILEIRTVATTEEFEINFVEKEGVFEIPMKVDVRINNQ